MASRTWTTNENCTIEFVSYNQTEHYNGLIEMLHKGFYTNESVCRSIGLDKDIEAQNELDGLVRQALKDGVTIIAVEKSTGKVVGAAINKIQVNSVDGEDFYGNFFKNCKQERTREIVEYLKIADEAVDLFKHCNVDCLLELMFMSVHPEFWNRRIGENLVKTTIEVARKLSSGENVKVSLDNRELSLEPVPKLVAALFTSPTSQRVGNKCGFEVAARLNYKDRCFNGKTYASGLEEGNTHSALVFKRL